MHRLLYHWIYVSMFFIATCCSKSVGFWFFSCPHGNGKGQAGDVCSAFCRCHAPNTCEAGIQRCAQPGVEGDRCHATRPCAPGFSCHPGVQKCFHMPRRYGEPCVAGFACGNGLSCEPGVQRCFRLPREYNEPCSAGFSCAPGLSCQPGYQRCLHHPRRENERCSAGYVCADGLVCRLCDKPYATCQLERVPALTDQDYDRPFSKVAFLVTHNSFAHSPYFAVWARNQRFSVRQQLKDGVRGLMLDIYPGWGEEDVRLCHASCFWSGSTNLLDTLIEIRKFLETNTREVITIFFEDYLRNPTILKRVFDQAEISPYVLLKENWGDGINEWPTLNDMRRLGRLVVFDNNGLSGFPYTEYNMWRYVRENRYGNSGQIKKECVDRAESRLNEAWNDLWSLVLINWFSTAANPLQPCLNSFEEIRDKLITCHDTFGYWANFVAVNYYTAGSGGGAFQIVNWLNDIFRRDSASSKEIIGSFNPFPSARANQQPEYETEPVIKKNTIEEPGYGSGFHNLSDILNHILQYPSSWAQKHSSLQNSPSVSPIVFNSNTSAFSSEVQIGPSQNNKHSKTLKSHEQHKTRIFTTNNLKIPNKEISQPQVHESAILNIVNSLEHGIKKETNSGDTLNSTNRYATGQFASERNTLVEDNKSGNSKLNSRHHVPKYVFANTAKNTYSQRLLSHGKAKLWSSSHDDGVQRSVSNGKLKLTKPNSTLQSSLPPSALRRKTNAISENSKTKLRNLRRQLARLKAKLKMYLHLARRQRRKQSYPNNKLRSKIINKAHYVPHEKARA